MFLTNIYENKTLTLLIEVVGVENLTIIHKNQYNGSLSYCVNTWKNHPNKDKYLLFNEAGVGNGWLTDSGREHRIEFLLICPNGNCVFIDSKYRKNKEYLFNLSNDLLKAGKVNHPIIYAFFGEVINHNDFQRFKTEIRYAPNIFIASEVNQFKQLLGGLI